MTLFKTSHSSLRRMERPNLLRDRYQRDLSMSMMLLWIPILVCSRRIPQKEKGITMS